MCDMRRWGAAITIHVRGDHTASQSTCSLHYYSIGRIGQHEGGVGHPQMRYITMPPAVTGHVLTD